MKILIVSMSAELGGIERSLICFLKFLQKMPRAEIDLMLWKCRGELLGEIPSGVSILPSPAPGSLKSILSNLQLKKLVSYFKLKIMTKKGIPWMSFPILKKKYDIAISYTQDGYSPYYIVDRVNSTRKYMWYHHGAYLHQGKKRLLDSHYYPRFTNIIAVSESIKDVLVQEQPKCFNNIRVINNLIDEDYIINSSIEPCKTFASERGICKILTVGRLSEEKGQLRALKIANDLKNRGFDFEWIFVGDGPQKEDCIKKTEELGLEPFCKFIGAKKNPYPYFKDSDLYVAPSYIEADPITIQEAMIIGTPIIASDITSIKKILLNTSNSYVVSFDDIPRISDKIISWYSEKQFVSIVKKAFTRNERISGQLNSLFCG